MRIQMILGFWIGVEYVRDVVYRQPLYTFKVAFEVLKLQTPVIANYNIL